MTDLKCTLCDTDIQRGESYVKTADIGMVWTKAQEGQQPAEPERSKEWILSLCLQECSP